MAYARNGGIRLYYEVVGEGEPLLLHYGFTESVESWYAKGFVEALSRDYRLVLFDSRGQGRSDKPHNPRSYTPAHRASDIVAVLDAAGIEQSHFFGYSQGGGAGYALWRYAPERLLSVAIGGASPYGQDLSTYRAMLGRDLDFLLSALEQAAGASLPDPLRPAFFENDLEALRAAYAENRPDISEGLGRTRLPTLLFAAEHDPVREAMRRFVSAIGAQDLLVLEGYTHVRLGLELHILLPHLRAFLGHAASQAA